jgi:hypothetical protein
MPTVNEALGGLLETAIKNPKSTASALLTCALVGIPGLLSCGCIHGKAAAVAGGILGAAKIYVGLIQKDATTLHIPAGANPVIQMPEGGTINQSSATEVNVNPSPSIPNL